MHRFFLYPIILNLFLPLTFEVNALPFFEDKCEQYKYSSSKLFKEKVSSVVLVSTEDAQGSGFVVKHDKGNTFILTNAHVVGDSKFVNIKWNNQEQEKGEVIGNLGGYELKNDLALIRIKGEKGKPQIFLKKSPEIGSDAVVIGSPSGLEFSLSRGVVSQIRDNNNFIQIDAPVNPGNSGGPVFNHAGCVIGMVTFKASENSEGLNFALSHNLISKFLDNPRIDKESISKAEIGNFTSNKQFIELWNGVYTGMDQFQVKSILGGNAKCWEDWGLTCNRDPIIMAGEEVIPVVDFDDSTVQYVMLHMRSKYKCKSADLYICAKEKKRNHYKSFYHVNKMLTQRYGNPIDNEDNTGYLYFKNRVRIELVNVSDGDDVSMANYLSGPDIGIWYIKYTVDESNL